MKVTEQTENVPTVSKDYMRRGYVYRQAHTGGSYYMAASGGLGGEVEYLVSLDYGTVTPLSKAKFDGWIEVEAEVVIK